MSHTPGPWIPDQGFAAHPEDHPDGMERFVFADIHPDDDENPWPVICGDVESEADAHLIAAAPDLLAALEREHPFTIHATGHVDTWGTRADYARTCEVCAAIAKAKGEA